MYFRKPCSGPVRSFYGSRTHPISGKKNKMHHGIDYGNTPGDNDIVAAASGTVTLAKWYKGFGNCVMIKHMIDGKQFETVYAHLSTINVKYKEKVSAGQKIGVKGTTGNSDGIHLHFEVHNRWFLLSGANSTDPAVLTFDPWAKDVQQKLADENIPVVVDGYFGKGSENAVKTFQKRYNLVADGMPGPDTLRVLNAQSVKQVAADKFEKEMDDMYAPSSKALVDATNEVLTMMENDKEKPLHKTHRKKYDAGKLSNSDALGLLFVAVQRGYFNR